MVLSGRSSQRRCTPQKTLRTHLCPLWRRLDTSLFCCAEASRAVVDQDAQQHGVSLDPAAGRETPQSPVSHGTRSYCHPWAGLHCAQRTVIYVVLGLVQTPPSFVRSIQARPNLRTRVWRATWTTRRIRAIFLILERLELSQEAHQERLRSRSLTSTHRNE